MKYQYITIEGNIGAGKTTLCQLLSETMDTKLILEQFIDNPFLPKFYNQPEKYAFQLEMSFLAERFKQLKTIIQTKDLFGQILLSDYLFIKCKLFAQINLATDEYKLFETLFDIIYTNLPMPDLIIYLHSPIEKLQENIKKRARTFEEKIPNEYLKNIETAYWTLIKTIKIPTLVIDAQEIDFLENKKELYKIKLLLQKEWANGVHYIDWNAI